MGIEDLIKLFWRPSIRLYSTYSGEQCLGERDVIGFEGTNAMGQVWQAYFDKETRLLVEAYTGLGS